ncbi:tetratricopeptide repeat protein [Microbacterium sp. cx-59]|uniref:tetratricopeptide repeat protein n=1 Tax=Microbacterium sp. cx-59 TaxID=2891207 RepID=UPI001E5176A9|nr:tetratricopeptide repeat protein [Microbacterium sp. cx-59]MCC4907186.1 tetratricopeptide repeat protein [Microbacterium sp. cx-59]
MNSTDEWDERVAAIWADAALTDDERTDAIERIARERPADDARALFERAGSYDSAGRETEAEPLYRAALAAGLDDAHRPQAVIQLASTIRNLGQVEESLELLRAEYERRDRDGMRDAAAAFYALALSSAGHDRLALSIALDALAPHLPRYTRSVTGYAAELMHAPRRMPTANIGEGL